MSERIADVFQYCPRCGQAAATLGDSPFRCQACEYIHFFSPCTAVAAIICDHDRKVLFLERQREPGKGKLGLPGGFVDAGESAEEALKREVFEEINLEVSSLQFLASFPNTYAYRGVALPVTDLFFLCEVQSFDSIAAQQSEVAGWRFCHPGSQQLEAMAFDSNRKAVEEFLRRGKDPVT